MTSATILRNSIEARLPSAFALSKRRERSTIPTGIDAIDRVTSGIPLSALTEICGSNVASSGKTSFLHSLLAQATGKYFCALVDAGDSFDPASAESAGVNFSQLLWVRCGLYREKYREKPLEKPRQKLPPLEQAFKAVDMLLQSGGFGLIVMDLSSIPEKIVRRVPLSSWFRFSRVLEKQSTALVVIGQRPQATSCAGLVLELKARPAAWSGKLLTHFQVAAEVVRMRENQNANERRPAQSAHPDFRLKSQWA